MGRVLSVSTAHTSPRSSLLDPRLRPQNSGKIYVHARITNDKLRQIPLRYLVAARSEAGRRPASSCYVAARELGDRPNSTLLQVCDQLRTCLRPDSVMECGFNRLSAVSRPPAVWYRANTLSFLFTCRKRSRFRRRAVDRRYLKAKFHYAIWFEAGRRPTSNQLRTR